MKPPADGWGSWTVILCMPSAVRRGLVEAMLHELRFDVEIVFRRDVVVTASQIVTHYAHIIGGDLEFSGEVAAELVGDYAGNTATVALGHGTHSSIGALVRARLGRHDPNSAWPTSIRGRWGEHSTGEAGKEKQYISDLIHASDDAESAERDFGVWLGEEYEHLLR
ncbi:nucleoside-diphosphate kinase [Herbidospora sp. RD11066]